MGGKKMENEERRYHNTEFRQGNKSKKKGNTFISRRTQSKYAESIEKCWSCSRDRMK